MILYVLYVDMFVCCVKLYIHLLCLSVTIFHYSTVTFLGGVLLFVIVSVSGSRVCMC